MVNIRTKGQTGEREIAKALNNVVRAVREHCGLPPLDDKDLPFQRNQNQSAVGGSDLSNPFGMAIEVKRQEALAVNTWWKQCLEQSMREKTFPILLYRQNQRHWKCRMLGYLILEHDGSDSLWRTNHTMAVEISWEDFLEYFKEKYIRVVLAE